VTGGGSRPAIFFLSDYGTADEFVGVVHAVLHRLAPSVPVIDLSHQIPPFDIPAGASMLDRCAPHLGAGVVLAVVDPGVGTDRRAVAVGVPAAEDGPERPTWLVGPDNGLLAPMAAAYGGPGTVVSLGSAPHLGSAPRLGSAHRDRRRRVPGRSGLWQPGPTFDGRDLFAPAAAHLALGGDPALLGPDLDPASLISEAAGRHHPDGGFGWARPGSTGITSVASVDRFGNVQLEVGAAALEAMGVRPGDTALVSVASGPDAPDGQPSGTPDRPIPVRRVRAFGELGDGEWGLLVDGTGHVALVRHRASAAAALRQGEVGDGAALAVGAQVRIAVEGPGTLEA
jgi:hypothetical protein